MAKQNKKTKNEDVKKKMKKEEENSEDKVKTKEEIEDEEQINEVEIEEKFEANPVKNTMSDKTRYIITALVAILFLGLIILAIVFGDSNTEEKNPTSNSDSSNTTTSNTPTKTKEERNTSTDTLKKFYKEFDSEKVNVIFFESSSCGYCQLQKPVIEQIAKDYDFKYYDIDASKLEEEEMEEMISALGISGATPTTVIVQKGKVIDTNEGYLDGKPFVEFFVKNGVLKEGSTYKAEEKLVEVSYKDFKNIVKKDDYKLVYLDTSACSACIEVRSILNDLAEDNDFEINYLSATNLTQDEVNSFVEDDLKELGYDDKTYTEEQQIKIPLLLVTKNNKIVDYVLESTEKSDYTKVLKEYGFVD